MPFAVNLERKEILFLLIIMKDREKDIQINDKSSVSVFVSLGPSNNAVFDKDPENEGNKLFYLLENKSLH